MPFVLISRNQEPQQMVPFLLLRRLLLLLLMLPSTPPTPPTPPSQPLLMLENEICRPRTLSNLNK
jgi:hypothetical protein